MVDKSVRFYEENVVCFGVTVPPVEMFEIMTLACQRILDRPLPGFGGEAI